MGWGLYTAFIGGSGGGDAEGENELKIGVVDIDHLLRVRFRVYREAPAQKKSNL